MKYLMGFGFGAAVLVGAGLIAMMKDPRDQITDGIAAAKVACETVGPKTDYERKVCAVVSP